MTDLSEYLEARERVAADLAADERDYPGRSFMLIYRDDLRTLLAGPPEPSEDRVSLTIRGVIGAHRIDQMQARAAAKAFQALYRSKTND